MSQKTLFDTYSLGDLKLKNRIVVASMTRGRSDKKTGVATEVHATYYAQRANAGLVITEASPISHQGNAHFGAACIYNQDHVKGWKLVTDAVHKKGAKIFIQLWHGGRVCKSADTGLPILAPSALPVKNYNDKGEVVESETPTEATVDDIKKIIGEFVNAAKLAKEAGFDGIELNAGNGYIIDNFLKSESNKRTDSYGGSVENRCRFPLEIVDALVKVWPANRVGLKYSPVGRAQYAFDENPVETYTHFTKELSKRKLGFIEVCEAGNSWGKSFFKSGKEQIENVAKTLRPHFSGTLIANEGYNAETGLKAINDGNADLVSFAKAYISNPDLAQRIKLGLELNNTIDWATCLFGDAKGYSDYPKHEKNDLPDDEVKVEAKVEAKANGASSNSANAGNKKSCCSIF